MSYELFVQEMWPDRWVYVITEDGGAKTGSWTSSFFGQGDRSYKTRRAAVRAGKRELANRERDDALDNVWHPA